jgi:hypothetical protein
MRLLGWDRRLLRFRAGEVRRGFVRGDDPPTVYVFICPITGQASYVGHNPAPSATGLNQDQQPVLKLAVASGGGRPSVAGDPALPVALPLMRRRTRREGRQRGERACKISAAVTTRSGWAAGTAHTSDNCGERPRWVGQLSFAGARSNGEVAPIPAVRGMLSPRS